MATPETAPAPAVGVTSPRSLARRIAAGDAPVVVVDVRDHADFAAWRVDAPDVPLDVRSLPLDTAMRRLDAVAADLPEGAQVVVASYVGDAARQVAAGLLALGVQASVLDGGMTGWNRLVRPVRVRLAHAQVKVIQVQRVSRGCLAYLVIAGERALVVDPGADVSGFPALAGRYDATISAVFDTHLHGDHLSGARELARLCEAELLLPEATLRRGITFADAVSAVSDGEELELGTARMRFVSLPGHTSDMTGVLLDGTALLAGDSLLATGVAAPEASGAEARELGELLHATLHERIFALGERIRLLPGHYGGGVRRAPISPLLRDARAAAPEVELPARAFAARLVLPDEPALARARAIAAVNAGRAEAGPELEAGSAHAPVHSG